MHADSSLPSLLLQLHDPKYCQASLNHLGVRERFMYIFCWDLYVIQYLRQLHEAGGGLRDMNAAQASNVVENLRQ